MDSFYVILSKDQVFKGLFLGDQMVLFAFISFLRRNLY